MTCPAAGELLEVRIDGTPEPVKLRFRESAVLGRDPSCALVVAGDGVSPRHAELYRVGNLWWIRDLGSETGTLVDGDPVDAAPVGGPTALSLGPRGPVVLLKPVSTGAGPTPKPSGDRRENAGELVSIA